MAIQKQCGKCKGRGGREGAKGGGWFNTREWIRCTACHGTGENPKYRSKSCEYCRWGTVHYSSDAKVPPKYCSESCKQGARNEENARRERERRDQQARHDGANRRYTHQQNRPHQDRPYHQTQTRKESDWLEKSCPGAPGNYCGRTIRYKASWDNPPQYCDECKNKEFEKSCGNAMYGCDRKIKFKLSWKDVPSKCGRCKKEEEKRSTPQRCPGGCNGIMFVPQGKSYRTCFACSQKQKSANIELIDISRWYFDRFSLMFREIV